MFGRRKRHQPNASTTASGPARSPERDNPHSADDFAGVYATYAGRVHAYTLQRLRDDDLAADITSTVFTRALANLASFEPREPGTASDSAQQFEGWLMTIARNAIIDHVRANKRLTILDTDIYRQHLTSTSPDPSNAPVAPDERDQLLDALRQLPNTQQRIVLLRLQGWNGVEIAELLGMSHSAVRTAQHRAYSRLRELIASERTAPRSRALTTEPDHV